eukprot:TRINITY_DN18489_c0_g2_i1.p1 TRINITY_DN18489_c0_g2~~TRINITY_DN18489_c0_g2_i1.p1  ORF type:complete len:290 (+),score=41.60 TRINITY_DN18489_c0_g2_i1:145-1014(+)
MADSLMSTLGGWLTFAGGTENEKMPRSEIVSRTGQFNSQARRKDIMDGDTFMHATSRDIEPTPRVYRERVLVRVYDLGQTVVTRSILNSVAKSYGAFHTGVEVYGREWSFGMTFDDYSTGITCNPPGQNADHNFRETLSMGYTSLSPTQVQKRIEAMKVTWKGSTYKILTRNCHNFSDEFCRALGVGGLPPWVNTLAETGAATAEWADSADSGYDGGEALFEFFSGVKQRISGALTWDDQENMSSKGDVRNSHRNADDEAEDQRYSNGRGMQKQRGSEGHPDPFSVLRR